MIETSKLKKMSTLSKKIKNMNAFSSNHQEKMLLNHHGKKKAHDMKICIENDAQYTSYFTT